VREPRGSLGGLAARVELEGERYGRRGVWAEARVLLPESPEIAANPSASLGRLLRLNEVAKRFTSEDSAA